MKTRKEIEVNKTSDDWIPNKGPQEHFLRCGVYEVGYGGAAGGGKAIDVNEPIMTSEGWKTMGEVIDGDCVLNEKGDWCNVVKAHPRIESPESYRLTFDDGTVIDCCTDHLWFTFNANDLTRMTRGKSQPEGSVKSTCEIVNTLRVRGRSNHAVPIAEQVKFNDKYLVIDPYCFGVWLGDGTSKNGSVTTIDQFILDQFKAKGYGVYLQPSLMITYGIHGLYSQLHKIGVFGNKHIPFDYEFSSIEQRISLIQGLMDSDGSCNIKGQCEFSVTNKDLAYSFFRILCSLGVKANIRKNKSFLYGKQCKDRYRIKFKSDFPCFRLPRKLELWKPTKRRTTKFRYIVKAEPIASKPMRCLTVDSPSRLYLVGYRYLPTHNTDGLLVDACKPIVRRKGYGTRYTGILFRRTFPELQGKIIPRSREIYPMLGGKYNEISKTWTFPKGERIIFAHMQHEKDKYKYQGGEYQWIGFDEVNHFTLTQYLYMHSRCRSSFGIPCHIRFSCNPDGPNSWVFKRFRQWLDPEIEDRAKPGEIRYFVPLIDVDSPDLEEVEADSSHDLAMPRTFIPSRLSDNPHLASTDYEKTLNLLTPLERKRLKDGNWLARPGRKDYFNRDWCELVSLDEVKVYAWFRGWDLAGTTNQNSDYTSTCKIGRTKEGFVIADVRQVKVPAGQVPGLIKATDDADRLMGHKCRISIPQDPGSAGVYQADQFQTKELKGLPVTYSRETGSKQSRFQPFSTMAYNKRVYVVYDKWNGEYFDQLEEFPGTEEEPQRHDDMVDATSRAYALAVEHTGTPDLIKSKASSIQGVLKKQSQFKKVF